MSETTTEESHSQIRTLIALSLSVNKYAESDPEVSLSFARKAAECICLFIFAREIGQPGDLIMLGELLKQLAGKKVLSNRVLIPLHTIQAYGNYGSHFQRDLTEIDRDFIIPCLAALRQVLKWYFRRYLSGDIPYELAQFVEFSERSTYSQYRYGNSDGHKVPTPTSTNVPLTNATQSRIPTKHLPVDSLNSNPPRKTLFCPDSIEVVQRTNSLTQNSYGPECIPFEIYTEWWRKNPRVLACLTEPDGEILGYFDVFPLADPFLEDFVEGKVCEKEMQPKDILSPFDSKKCGQLYLEGMAVKSPETFAGKRNANILLWGLFHYLKSLYPGKRPRMLYALGSTHEGDELLRRFNFTGLTASEERSDGHNFYALPFTQAVLDEYLSLIQDWSTACTMSWPRIDR